jgi:hypothetical protein
MSNYIDYGRSYFELEVTELTLKESKKIVAFIAGIVR